MDGAFWIYRGPHFLGNCPINRGTDCVDCPQGEPLAVSLTGVPVIPQTRGDAMFSDQSSSVHRRGFTLVEFLVVLAIIAVLVALLLPPATRGRGGARRAECKNNLKQIGLALHNYLDKYQSFPPAYTVDDAGRPLHSWRVLILPFMDSQALYDQIDLSKPWNDPVNAAVAAKRPSVYACPSTDIAAEQTTYLAIVGEAAAFLPGEPRDLSDFEDGMSKTLFVIDSPQAQSVHWMAPQDADTALLLRLNKETQRQHTSGLQGLMGDGAVRFLSENLPRETWQGLCTIRGNEPLAGF